MSELTLGKTRFLRVTRARDAMRRTTTTTTPFELYIVTLFRINLEQLLRRQLGPFVIRVVDAAGRCKHGSSRI